MSCTRVSFNPGRTVAPCASSTTRSIDLPLPDVADMDRSDAWCVQQASRVLADGYYKFAAPHFASKENSKNPTTPPQLSLLVDEPFAMMYRPCKKVSLLSERGAVN